MKMYKRKDTAEVVAARLRRHKKPLPRDKQNQIDTAMRWAAIAAWPVVRRVT